MPKYNWSRDNYAGFVCEMPNNVTLIASPRLTRSRGFRLIAAPNTAWQAQCSVWNESTRTISRFGRDAWEEKPVTAKEAKALAQLVYEEMINA
jgi:hypothetical protein